MINWNEQHKIILKYLNYNATGHSIATAIIKIEKAMINQEIKQFADEIYETYHTYNGFDLAEILESALKKREIKGHFK